MRAEGLKLLIDMGLIVEEDSLDCRFDNERLLNIYSFLTESWQRLGKVIEAEIAKGVALDPNLIARRFIYGINSESTPTRPENAPQEIDGKIDIDSYVNDLVEAEVDYQISENPWLIEFLVKMLELEIRKPGLSFIVALKIVYESEVGSGLKQREVLLAFVELICLSLFPRSCILIDDEAIKAHWLHINRVSFDPIQQTAKVMAELRELFKRVRIFVVGDIHPNWDILGISHLVGGRMSGILQTMLTKMGINEEDIEIWPNLDPHKIAEGDLLGLPDFVLPAHVIQVSLANVTMSPSYIAEFAVTGKLPEIGAIRIKAPQA